MQSKKTFDISSFSQLDKLCEFIANQIKQGQWIYLNGDLGSGKTTFSQRFIKQLGYEGIVSSPTYAIMQSYQSSSFLVVHSDLYRLGDPEELYEIGLIDAEEYAQAIFLVEWPQKGEGILPKADWILDFELSKNARTLTITSS